MHHRIIEAWNKRPTHEWSPAIGTALTAGYRWLSVYCPGCHQVAAVDLETVDRHPLAAITSLILTLRCERCLGSGPLPELRGMPQLPPCLKPLIEPWCRADRSRVHRRPCEPTTLRLQHERRREIRRRDAVQFYRAAARQQQHDVAVGRGAVVKVCPCKSRRSPSALPLKPLIWSLREPGKNEKRSAPVPPAIVSSPSLPKIVSLPAPPLIEALPKPPTAMSAPSPVSTVSLS